MDELLRISKVNQTKDFPIRSSTCYKWYHTKKHSELFCKLGGALFINVTRLKAMISNGGTSRR
jgi:hypothetical protein